MPDLVPVFVALRALLAPYAAKLDVKRDSASELYLDTPFIQKNKKPLFFGAVVIKKNYVSYHLMPVYVDPSLLDGLSADLRRRMQGKSCFNFSKVDTLLIRELAALTKAGFAAYKARGFV